MTSVAFPALGAGQLGFPVDKVAFVMINSIKNNRKSSVKSVIIVLYPKDKKALKVGFIFQNISIPVFLEFYDFI